MIQNKQNKLELTWIGKYDERKPLEPRILIENKDCKHSISRLDAHYSQTYLCAITK